MSFASVIPLLGNGIKEKETTIAEPVLEVSSHMLPCMYLAASERQIHNHNGMQSVWKVQTRYNYSIRKKIISAHLQKATLGGDSLISPQWFISYNCNYLFETVQWMTFHQVCIRHPAVISNLFLEEKKNNDYFIPVTKTFHKGKMIHIKQLWTGEGLWKQQSCLWTWGRALWSCLVEKRYLLHAKGGHDYSSLSR